MYDELIKRLRETSLDFGELDDVSVMMIEAANAIEELSKRSECPCWYGDVRICSLLGMPIGQPLRPSSKARASNGGDSDV